MDSTISRFSFSLSVSIHLFLFAICFLLLRTTNVSKLIPLEKDKNETTWIEVVPSLSEKSIQEKVVDSSKGKIVKNAVDQAFLGERTQIVEKQMIHEGASVEAKRSKSVKTETSKNISSNQKIALSDLGVKIDFQKIGKNETKEIIQAEEEGELSAQANGEYVKGFEKGAQTLLNTKEYVFYGYFKRVRTSLDKAWDTTLKEQMNKYFRRGRQLASETEYTTKLLVVLNQSGEITKIQMISKSGTQDLDEASVKAFNTAGPFPNPPKGLVDKNGEIKIRWDFVVRT